MWPRGLIQPEADVPCLSPEHDPRHTLAALSSSPSSTDAPKQSLSLICRKFLRTKKTRCTKQHPELRNNERKQMIFLFVRPTFQETVLCTHN